LSSRRMRAKTRAIIPRGMTTTDQVNILGQRDTRRGVGRGTVTRTRTKIWTRTTISPPRLGPRPDSRPDHRLPSQMVPRPRHLARSLARLAGRKSVTRARNVQHRQSGLRLLLQEPRSRLRRLLTCWPIRFHLNHPTLPRLLRCLKMHQRLHLPQRPVVD